MQIAIISDIHDNLPNLNKCLNWCASNQITKIIFCGDATTLDTIKNLAAFPGEIFMVRGNAELYEDEDLAAFQNIQYQREAGVISLEQINIGLTHEPKKINRLLKSPAPDLDYIFYGHTHKPWLEQRDLVNLANPGNLAGIFYPATFATLDTATKKLELKILAQL